MPTPEAALPRYIAVEGPIGVGKTTLALKLSKHAQSRLVLEEFTDNPFLREFYRDRRRVAFQTQVYFLIAR
ncbi:MAG: deoxynucleoside kinase, partial [Deltaproteobacteria bacterium]|nr:deoxynucleoside kinase [Deltaproteobacteria bacterium]